MTIRMKTYWHQEKERSFGEFASALGLMIWKVSSNRLLEMENAGFMTHSNMQRLAVVGEFIAFLLQVTDRLTYQRLNNDQRSIFINALAKHLIRAFVENQIDLFGQGNDYEGFFTDFLNQRAEEYANLGFINDEAQVDFLRHFGLQLEKLLSNTAENKHWIVQHVIELDAPQAIKSVRQTLDSLLT
jgi:hypothetical protein